MDLLNGITEGLGGHGDRDADRQTLDDEPPTSDRDKDSTSDRGDEHVCDFCGADFDASLGQCPDCGAEIIVRGAR